MNSNEKRKRVLLYGFGLLCIVASMLFIQNNFNLYDQPIAEVVTVTLKEKKSVAETINEDELFVQTLVGKIKNGAQKDQLISLENTYSSSGAFDHRYQVGDNLFVAIQSSESVQLTGTIDGPKRDKYVLAAAWLFILTVLIVGKKSGLFSLISLAINILVLYLALNSYINSERASLLLISSGLAIFFTVTSLLLVNGKNEKTLVAILATIMGTFSALLIAYLTMWLTAEQGLRYEEMAFITRSPQKVFLASILIGSLGAVMDIAITITSSLYELYDKNNAISLKDLKVSGNEIGKDIMGTMTNVLFFAYVSGGIPMILLYLKNGSTWGYTLSMNLSLELTRALVGSIGIVLTIPISIQTTLYFIRRRSVAK
ncbi:YibE/F family protein [Carnobacterium pleistocenium]|uniref:YibE/F family protein n=1 Tax=Carnobacterium pleistocenium TaxID=181073 RepID=UPI0005550687|nr:YibE/F family protein [Carnobacterium pleistocenium]